MGKERIKDSVKTWNTIGKSFNHTRKHPWTFCIDYISSLNLDCVCADFGCGNGRHLIPLAQQCKKAIGFDISHELLRITAERIKNQNINNTILVEGDLCVLPFHSNIFDHAIYIAALHNIRDQKNRIQSLKELFRVIKPTGTALVSVWKRNQNRFPKDIFLNSKGMENGDIIVYWQQHNLKVPRFYHLYEKEEFKNDIERADFHIKSLQEITISSKKKPDNFYAILEKT
jgi:tRNA (uracil-5-)-methyltransferase TRM9